MPATKDRDFDDHVSTAVMPPKQAPEIAGAMVRVAGVAAKPQEFRVTELAGVCRIGSGEANDIVVRDRTVSRQHAELTLTREGVRVRDLESKNGTFFLGQRVREIVLAIGARVTLGAVTIEIDPDTEGLLDALSYEGTEYRGVLGASPRMKKLFALLARLEPSIATVLVEGESGVGKECVARAIHDGSPCASGRLVPINCGAIPKELVASELFGHKRGAFTGAVESRKGAFELADGGTLFLDEIGELPIDVQPTLLRALELGEIRPVGQEQPLRVKVRVVAATNRDLPSEVAAGRFRQDLFYRLAVVRLHVPPLRARPEDIELLGRHFAREARLADIPPAVMEDLKSRAWPGNARELRNAIHAYAALGSLPAGAPATSLAPEALFDAWIDPTQPYADQKDVIVEHMTRAYLKSLLRFTNGNQAAAARIAKLDRTYLGRLMAKYGLR